MRLPTTKKILREDLKDAPAWVSGIIDPINSFMETVYQALNKNITFSENIRSYTKDLTYITPAGYPTMDDIEIANELKVKATMVLVVQAYEKANYTPAVGPVYVPWVEMNGQLVIKPITGLAASKTYIIRILVS